MEKSKKKLTFSVLDFIIIILALSLIIGIFARYDIVKKLFDKTEQTEVKVSFSVQGISAEEAGVFAEGTRFYCEDELFGILQSSIAEKALIYKENSDGVLVSYEDEKLFDVNGTFICKASSTDSGYLLGGKSFFAPGSVFTVTAGSAKITITVLSISENS